jgi:hypothetical protein
MDYYYPITWLGCAVKSLDVIWLGDAKVILVVEFDCAYIALFCIPRL